MSQAIHQIDSDLETERRLLEAAVAEAEADQRYVSHEDMRAWLLQIAQGNFNAPPPDLRDP